jgi:hypothetical protein
LNRDFEVRSQTTDGCPQNSLFFALHVPPLGIGRMIGYFVAQGADRLLGAPAPLFSFAGS